MGAACAQAGKPEHRLKVLIITEEMMGWLAAAGSRVRDTAPQIVHMMQYYNHEYGTIAACT
jgi:hypothetical protein